jgi:DinB family protein
MKSRNPSVAEMLASPLYADLVGSEAPLTLLASTPRRIAEVVRGWDARRWSQTYAPGKWTAAQIILHLAHDEICWGNRVRFALSVDDYVVQPFDGAKWVALETLIDPNLALRAFLALRELNLALYGHIPPDRRARPIRHPEFGQISIDWIFHTLAGHDCHHLEQLQTIAGLTS